LGQHTADNPTYWYDSPNSWQVGVNIVDAATASGLRLLAPLTAYALPGKPDHLAVSGGGGSGEILTWSATLKATVENKFNNPISNAPVSFSMGTASSQAICTQANNDLRQGVLVDNEAPCLNNHIPVYGECGAGSLAGFTSSQGIAAHVILGGVPDGAYPITVAALDLPPQTIVVNSLPFGNCDGESPPAHNVVLTIVNLLDQFGKPINAAGVGQTIPMQARMHLVSESARKEQKEYSCDPSGSDTCQVVVGARTYMIDTDFNTAEVTFGGQGSANRGDGLFELDAFAVGDVPAQKTVTITGRSTKTGGPGH